MAQFDITNYEKEVKTLSEKVTQDQVKEQQRRMDIERYIIAAREAMERERQDRYLLLVEQNKLKHKVEKLSESCKSYQVCIFLFCYLNQFPQNLYIFLLLIAGNKIQFSIFFQFYILNLKNSLFKFGGINHYSLPHTYAKL